MVMLMRSQSFQLKRIFFMILDPVSLGAVIEIEGFSLELRKNRKSSLVNFVTFNLAHNISLI